MSTSGPSPVADLLADKEHRRFVHLAFADDDGARDGNAAQFAAHGIDRGLVGGLLVAASAQARGRNGCCFGDARYFEHEHALETAATWFLIPMFRSSRPMLPIWRLNR